jgi:type IV pilus assembly protein PilY1
LGDIVDGQPVVVSAPSGSTNDASYSTFKSTNSSRNIVMVGANDGMLHAFDADTMGELAGYIPSAVYPHLRALTATDYGVSGGTSHTYHVNGGMRQQDIKVGGNWKTIVVGTLGQGGQGYYAVDATDVSKFLSAGAMVKWEWTDQNNALGGTANTSSAGLVGYAMNPPVIYNVRTSATTVVPAVIFSNGYQNGYDDTVSGGVKTASNSSHLFIVNADTGALIKRIDLPTTGSYKSEGLSAPAVVDVGQDGIADYVYAGDVNGNMWRFDLIDDNPINFKVGRNSTNDMVPIFQDPSKHPIVMRPGVMGVSKSDGTGIGNMVLFGTGQLLTDADRSDVDVQVLYGILDKSIMSDDIIAPITTVATLQQQSVVDTVTTTTNRIGTYRKVSTNYIDLKDSANTKDGWYIELPVLSERLVTSPLVFDDKVLFGTGIPKASEKCLPGGEGWVMGLNPLTGSVATKLNSSTGTAFSFIDINGDKKSSTADKLTFSSGSAYMSGYRKDGIPTELTYVSGVSTLTGPSDFSGTDPYSGAGSYIALREANSMAAFTGVGRTSISRGVVIKRLVSAGKGGLYGGTVGSTSLDKEDLTGPPTTAARVESTTWREIK